MKTLLGFIVLALAQFAGSALANSPVTQGSCTYQGRRMEMIRMPTDSDFSGPAWRAQIAPGLRAEVSFRPGYGMSFVTLALLEGEQHLASSTAWISGNINADSVASDTQPGAMDRFDTLSFEVALPSGVVSCGYRLYAERDGG